MRGEGGVKARAGPPTTSWDVTQTFCVTSWEASHQADCKCMNVFLVFVASPVFNSGGGTRGRHANGKPQGVSCILADVLP